MKVAVHGSALRRRIVFGLGLVAVLAAAPLSAHAQAPAAGAADQFMFKSEVGLIQWQVKADKTADFESGWSALRTKLASAPKPELKAVADSLRMYRSEGPAQDAPGVGKIITYYFVLDPASTTNSYDPSKLLYETGDLFARAEADAIFNKLAESLAGIGTIPLKRIQ